MVTLLNISAQELASSIFGKIIATETQTPLEYANIVLLSLPDSSFISGTVSDKDGIFQLNSPSRGKYLLKISYVGFDVKFVPFEAMETSIDLGNILLLESNILKEVVVTSKAPPFQTGSSGGIVANVSTTLLSTVGTANDVLHRMPGINAENNKITVFGKGSPLIYINNRKVRDNSELERLESSEISTVELITNPGAKYDAEGRAVLLIKTKSKIDGFTAQITERLRIANKIGDNENVSISYTKDRLNLFSSYLHNYNSGVESENHFFTLQNTDGLWQHSTLLPSNKYSNQSQQASIGFDFSINEKHAIGGQYQFNQRNTNLNFPIYSSSLLNGTNYDKAFSESITKDNNRQHLVSAFYNGNFNDKYSLRFDIDYFKNYDNKVQNIEETNNNGKLNYNNVNEINILNQTDYDLYAGKLTNTWKPSFGLIEFGGEYNNISGKGFVESNIATNSSEFTNIEQKMAGFMSYSHKFLGVDLTAGLRYELTFEKFTKGKEQKPFINHQYSDWYPSISISKRLKLIDISVSFNKRTQRPSFSQLNGNVVYINRFVFQKGDPYLKKSNIYELNLQATAKSFNFNAGYTYLKDPILLYFKSQNENTGSILSTYTNFPKYETLYATLNWNTKIGFWQPNYTAGIEQPFFKATYDGREMEYNKTYYFFRFYNDFTLPYGIILSGNFRYQSDAQEASYELKSWKRADIGIRKSILNNSLRFNLMVYDIFNWVKENAHFQIDNLNWNANKKRETRYATLSITYIMNNYTKKYRGSSAAQDDIKRF